MTKRIISLSLSLSHRRNPTPKTRDPNPPVSTINQPTQTLSPVSTTSQHNKVNKNYNDKMGLSLENASQSKSKIAIRTETK